MGLYINIIDVGLVVHVIDAPHGNGYVCSGCMLTVEPVNSNLQSLEPYTITLADRPVSFTYGLFAGTSTVVRLIGA